MNLSFIADIEIPKGSITILNSVDKVLDRDTEFDIIIEGPNDTEYTLSLKAGDSKTLENLWIGDYTIYAIVPMVFKKLE